jgi:hypothetical protein
MNLSNRELAERLDGAEDGPVYSYVISTIQNRNGQLVQTGCGPNVQGEVMTLCTCKRSMRTTRSPRKWAGAWIAGFTGTPAGNGHNRLVYLMQVATGFESQAELWNSGCLAPASLAAKAAHCDPFGDLFQPLASMTEPWNPRQYHPPIPGHAHGGGEEWHRDIAFFNKQTAAPQVFLVGNPQFSFLWTRPMYTYADVIGRGHRRHESLGNWANSITEVEA